MALIRWEPYREMENIQRQMNRLFDRMMPYGNLGIEGDRPEGMTVIPAAEIHETENEVKVKIEVPGIEAKDLDVKVAAEAVSIRGERRSEVNRENGGTRVSEFRYGSFQRVIPLPARVQNDRVRADFQNGVLCLTLPKAEDEKHRVVTLNLQGQNSPGRSLPEPSPNRSEVP
ncbi:Hsp20/alpha crystallin family protein [Pannus brasiliensis CCIBt3594]|uniref:Hsp20/alpha crystallin family protein n=1 Tax=Pannus brasiliensis CCIBt3594 TaxID=1427578 RepID=A0AAW9QQ51_9CHRO